VVASLTSGHKSEKILAGGRRNNEAIQTDTTIPMAGRTTTKHYIPHPEENNISIVGILEQLAPNQPTDGREIALVRPLKGYIH